MQFKPHRNDPKSQSLVRQYSLPSGIDDTRSTEYKFRNTDWLSFIALICMIIKLVQLIKSVASDGLMNRRNIKRLRLLSYFMITFYLVSYIDSFITTSYYRSHLSLGDNQICYPELSASVTIAFILLLLAEILNIAYKQREELDLTI